MSDQVSFNVRVNKWVREKIAQGVAIHIFIVNAY
jgi:hypothetical protein